MRTKMFATVALLSVVVFTFSTMCSAPARAEDLTVICYGGSFEEGWRKSVIERFEKKYSGDKIHIATGLTMQIAAMMRAQKDNVEIDVIMMDEVGSAQAHAEGLWEPLTVDKVPNLNLLYPKLRERTQDRPYTYFMWVAEALWYNTEKFQKAPESWQVMFDPKYAGRISFPDINTSHGVWMLNMAARMNGGSESNIDPGIEAIKKIRDGIHAFWTIHGQIQQLFARGEVWLTSDSTDRCAHIMRQGVPVDWTIPKEGAYIISSTIGIAKGTKHKELAYRYINFILDPETQAANARHILISPVVEGAPVDQSLYGQHLLPSPDDFNKLLDLDWDVVTKKRPEWTERWRREIAIK